MPARSNDAEVSRDGAVIKIRTTGRDPYLVWSLDKPLDQDRRILAFEYIAMEAISPVYGFFGPPISESSRLELPDLTIAQGWQPVTVDLVAAAGKSIPQRTRMLRIDFGMTPDREVQIRDLTLRRPTAEETNQAAEALQRREQKIAQDASIRSYLNSSFPLKFDTVTVDDQWVTLVGSGTAAKTELTLIEYPPHEPISGEGIACDDQMKVDGDRFQVTLVRRLAGRDRLQSGWRIGEKEAEGGVSGFLTARHHATLIVPKRGDHAARRAEPKSQKGLSGISDRGPLDDFPQLGIHAATLNLVLDRFVSTTPGPGKQRIEVPGTPVFFDPRVFAGYDGLIDFARRHEIVVTAIVLIRRSKNSGSQSPLAHPESDGGVYVMPDLSSDRGAQIYAFVLDKIAERYRNPEKPPGGISNWIAHNEIDFHPVWTNMGRQPRAVLTETYYRSIRMIHNAARAHNPHARVFASLTHHWVVPDDGQWNQLAPREVLATLDRYAELEGDFAWGVAYHPYPQSLFAPVAWRDTNVDDDLDTPLITMQNLEVLGRYLGMPEMRDGAGKMRPVLLSEQGFHTDTYEQDAQDRQAGSLWYAMKKVRSLPWIESFHYHRWIDHPEEGGLMLGLRTLPTKEQPQGRRKRAWHVYQAIGTENEASATEGLPQP